MIKRLNLWDFVDEFDAHGRRSQFSSTGFEALFDFLETEDEDMELDVIAISVNILNTRILNIQ